MKLLQISNYYYPHIGGIEQVARDISDSVQCERKVFCFNSGKNSVIDTVDGVEVVRAGCFAKIASQSLSFRYGKMLKKTFAAFKPDLVIFHYPNPFAAHFLLKILKKYPDCKLIVYWHLDIVKQKFLKLFFNGQNKRLLIRADKVVCTSPNYLKYSPWLSPMEDKCVVIPNCLNLKNLSDCDLSDKTDEIKSVAANKKICFAIGRHIPYKGMEYLVKASRYLPDDYKIYIAGQGPLTERLKELAAEDEKITFLGKISEEDKIAYYKACDIFCFPSVTKNEAFGIALAEAMSFGKPAVTFTIEGSGVNYVSLSGVTGIEVENGNSEKFAGAIKTLGENQELAEKYGAAAKKRVEENFTFEKFKENINNLIKEYNV
ncbi:MAG: glycosyltransferase [Christensenellaceae bacterium]